MNILILGLLLLVAAAAILGAVLLSLSDQRASRASHVLASGSSAAAPEAEGRPALVTRRLEDASAPAPASATLPALNEATTTLPYSRETHDEEFAPRSLNGQFHELAVEIRQLHLQAAHLEQRLGVLTEMVGHMQQSPVASEQT